MNLTTDKKKITLPIVNSSKPKALLIKLIEILIKEIKPKIMSKNLSKLSMKSISNSLVLKSILIILSHTMKDLLKMSVNQIKLNSTKLMMYHFLSDLKTILTKNKQLKLNSFPTILLSKCLIPWFLNKDLKNNSKDWQKHISQIFS